MDMTDNIRIFWVELEVRFRHPRPVYSEDEKEIEEWAAGFVMEFGISAYGENEACNIIESLLRSDELEISEQDTVEFTYVGEISSENLQQEVYDDPDISGALEQPPTKYGIWYRSEPGFFWDEEDENSDQQDQGEDDDDEEDRKTGGFEI